jgi:uncharacterized protein (DUF4213/DUF364 family)
MDEVNMLMDARRRFISGLESCFDQSHSRIGLKDTVVVSSPLSPREAIGETGRNDFPLLKGKEVLMQAVYRGSFGQAFTPAWGSFSGSLGEVLDLPLTGSFERAVLVSTMNAVLRYMGLVCGTVHCRDDGPKRCATQMALWIKEQKGERVGLVGMQPALLEALVGSLGPDKVMVSDLAEAGKVRCGVRVLDGMDSSELFEGCQIILVTGSSLVNGTLDGIMEKARRHDRRVVFYGSTISGVAYLLDLERWCPCSA